MSYGGWLTVRQQHLALTHMGTLLRVRHLLGKVIPGKCPIEVRLFSQSRVFKGEEKRPTHNGYSVPRCPPSCCAGPVMQGTQWRSCG